MFSFIIGLLIGSSIWLLSSTLIEYFIERDKRKQVDLFPSDEEMDDMAVDAMGCSIHTIFECQDSDCTECLPF